MVAQAVAGLDLALLVLRTHIYEGGQAEPQLAWIETDLVSLDDTALLELAKALEGRTGRHPDTPGDLGIGQPGILLEQGEDATVHFVDHAQEYMNRRTKLNRKAFRPHIVLRIRVSGPSGILPHA